MKKHYHLAMAMLSALLTVVGYGSCKSSKMAAEKQERQLQAYQDSVARAQAEDEARAAKEARLRFLRDSIRRDSLARSQKVVYGGPAMMDRRAFDDDSIARAEAEERARQARQAAIRDSLREDSIIRTHK